MRGSRGAICFTCVLRIFAGRCGVCLFGVLLCVSVAFVFSSENSAFH